MKVLISAYACEPDKGSEPGVGLAAVLGAARHHDVWVVTRENNVEAVNRVLGAHPDGQRVRVVGFDLDERALVWKRRLGRFGVTWYYDRWQKAVGDIARRLDAEVGFDVVHHVTFATIWGRIGVAALDRPLVVGPVGGLAVTPVRLWPVLGPAGIVDELVRRVARPLMAWLTGSSRAQARAEVLFVQNPTALRGRQQTERVRVLPNALVGAEASVAVEPDDPPRVVFAGRLIGWKGAILAVEAMRHVTHATAVLDVYGGGPQQRRLEKAVSRWGLADRVRLHGPVPRPRLLDAIARAAVLVHPSLHDEAGLVIAEALAAGTPVVCLDLAGPPVVASYWPEEMSAVVRPGGRRRVVRELARAIDGMIGRRGPAGTDQAAAFLDALEDAYRVAARVRGPAG